MIIDSGNRLIFEGNGQATDFPYSFKIIKATDIKVAISDDATGEVTLLTSDYFVDVNASKVVYPGYSPGQEPASEDIPEVLPDGKKLIVYREVPMTQESDLGTKYPFKTIEAGLDKNCILIQQIGDAQGRSLTLPVSTPLGFATDLPTPVPKTSFRVNDAGTGYEVTVDPATVLPLAENIKSEVETLKSETEEYKDQAENAAATAAAEAAATAATEAVADVQDELDDIVTAVNTAKATAVASAATASTKASEAGASATTATSAATTATSASSSASNYAGLAQTASANATTASNNATAKATEASNSASTASSAATTATNAETTIAGYVTTVESAVTNATNASASAVSAANSADSSAATATTAAQNASTAQSAAAQSAADAAQSAADAAAAAGGDFLPASQKGNINGVASLDASGSVPATQLGNVPDVLATVAESGEYSDLLNKPAIPSKVSDLTNDTGFITGVSWSGVTDKPSFATVATSGKYSDLSGKPTIPSKVSQLTNDSGFITGVNWGGVTGKPTNFVTSASGALEISADASTSLTAGVADSTTASTDSTKKLALTEWVNNQIVASDSGSTSGSTANAQYYVRYADGTQRIEAYLTSDSINYDVSITFLVPFTQIDSIQCTPDCRGSAPANAMHTVRGLSNTQLIRETNFTNIGGWITIEGRWK